MLVKRFDNMAFVAFLCSLFYVIFPLHFWCLEQDEMKDECVPDH